MFNYLGAGIWESDHIEADNYVQIAEGIMQRFEEIQRCESNLARPTEKRMWKSFLSSWHILQLQSTAYDHDWLFE